jgi:hypothetical protein
VTRHNAERTANIIMGVVGLAASLFVLRNAALRKTAVKLGRTALVAGGPWLAREAAQAWRQSRRV